MAGLMTDLAPLPVGGPDHEIWRLLLQIVAIGQHRGTWTSADVVRVSEAHLSHPRTLRRQLLNERQRADRLAEEVATLRQRMTAPKPGRRTEWLGPSVAAASREVVLKPYQARILDELVTGTDYDTISERLEITRSSVTNAVSRICQAFAVKNSREVVAAVWSKRVIVRIEGRVERRAA